MAEYKAKIVWTNDAADAFAAGRYTRGHRWAFDGGVDVPASSSPNSVRPPFSVEAAVDPEEALVAAASSCHMLSFLWLASKAGFVAESYEDDAVGEMTIEDGIQWISRITLDPQVIWAEDNEPTLAELCQLHHEAHEVCYIANSIKSEVVVKGF